MLHRFGLFFSFLLLSVGMTSAQSTASMVGTLGVGYRDYQDGRHAVEYTLHTLDGADIPLIIPPDVMAAAGGLFAIQGSTIEVVMAAPTRDGSITAAAIHAAAGPRWYSVDPVGTVDWHFLLCKFSDVSATPLSFANVQTMVGATEYGLATYWSETTHGVTTTNTTAYNWKTLDNPQSHYTGMGDGAARAALLSQCAAKHGVSTSGSRNIAVVLNARMFSEDYAYGGYSYSGSQVQRTIYLPAWAIQSHYVIAHEQGHGYGMPHSDNSDNDDDPYDNPWDVMSDSFYEFALSPYGYIATPTNLYYYHQLNILQSNQLFTLGNNSTATIVIEDWLADSVPGGHYRGAFIPFAGGNELYTIEVHKGTNGGFNSGYRPNPTNAPVDAVIIYRVSETEPGTKIPHLVGGNTNAASYDMSSAWTPGETYTDATNKIKIEILGASSDGFLVRLTRGTPSTVVTPTPEPSVTPDPSDVFALITPAQNAVMTSGVTLTWDGLDAATSYKVKLKNKTTGQLLNFTVAGDCGLCTLTPDYAALGWKWNDSAAYMWRVIAKADGAKIGKTGKHTFTTDLMPASITISTPVSGQILTGTTLNAQFTADARIEQYRVVVKHENSSLKTGWLAHADICSGGTCSVSVDLTAFAGGAQNGSYSVKVTGRSAISANKAKSAKHLFAIMN